MPALLALAAIAVIAAWTKMHPKDKDAVLGVNDKKE